MRTYRLEILKTVAYLEDKQNKENNLAKEEKGKKEKQEKKEKNKKYIINKPFSFTFIRACTETSFLWMQRIFPNASAIILVLAKAIDYLDCKFLISIQATRIFQVNSKLVNFYIRWNPHY